MSTVTATDSGWPWFDQLRLGQTFDAAPGLTLTDGVAAVHHAIVGDRLALALDHDLASRVVGDGAPLAHPALVWGTRRSGSRPWRRSESSPTSSR